MLIITQLFAIVYTVDFKHPVAMYVLINEKNYNDFSRLLHVFLKLICISYRLTVAYAKKKKKRKKKRKEKKERIT